MIDYKETLLEIQKMFKNDTVNHIIEFHSKHEVLANGDQSMWTTEIKVNSPVVVSVSAKGVTQGIAEQTAAALMIIKLRVSLIFVVFGFLTFRHTHMHRHTFSYIYMYIYTHMHG